MFLKPLVKILQLTQGQATPPNAKEYIVRTRDGVDLATDVYLPSGAPNQTFPAILTRTPYDKSGEGAGTDFYMNNGYVFVAQDVRGKFRSSGVTDPFTYDVDDAYDTVDWITKQPWSDGRVAAIGQSYYGFTTWATVASGHPAVKAAIPQVTSLDMGNMHVSSNWHEDVPPLLSLSDLFQIWSNNNGYLLEVDWTRPPPELVEASGKLLGESSGAKKLLERSKEEKHYNPYGDHHPYNTTKIPILHWQGWYDHALAPLGMKDFRRFRQQSAPNRNNHYLRVDSADHAMIRLSDVDPDPEISNGTARAKSDIEVIVDFFDEHVKGLKPSVPQPQTRWHIGHLGWQESPDFPPPTQEVTFYLSANPGNKTHTLEIERPAVSSNLNWTHDPQNPIPATTSIEAIWFLLAEYPDERELMNRPDVLTFRTALLPEDFIFVG